MSTYINRLNLNKITEDDFAKLDSSELLELHNKLIDTISKIDRDYNQTLKEFEHLKNQLEINEIVLETQKKMTERALKEIEKLSITDALTKLFNRRHFNEISEKELKRASRDRKFFTFVIFDIDYFKQYNDNYGHKKGDEALELVGKLLISNLNRVGDYPFRLGGEEFGLIFSGLDLEKSKNFCEEIRVKLQDLKIEHKYSKAHNYLTASFGLVTLIPEKFESMDHLYIRADEALYISKMSGKNRVSIGELDKKGDL